MAHLGVYGTFAMAYDGSSNNTCLCLSGGPRGDGEVKGGRIATSLCLGASGLAANAATVLATGCGNGVMWLFVAQREQALAG
jgi:hypothetical protein